MTEVLKIKHRFKSSIKRGTGEAHLIIESFPAIDFSADIIKASLHNYAYDGQSENSRATYLFELISFSKYRDKIRNEILKGLATEKHDTWTLTQLFDLAKLFAQSGDNESRQAIYNRFYKHPIDNSDWVGYSEILELYGLDGLKFIANRIGEGLEKNPDIWQDDMIIKHFQNDNPQIDVLKELEKASEENRNIKSYLAAIKSITDNEKNNTRKTFTYKDLVEEVLMSKPYISLFRRKLTESEIKLIANELLKTKNKHHQEKLLYVFTQITFPYESEFILRLANHKSAAGSRIAEFAIDALKYIKNEDVRFFALERLKTTKNPAPFTNILILNYQIGDSKLLTDTALKFHNEHTIENLARSYVDIFETNHTKECKAPLEAIYSKLTCGIHRNSIVKILIFNNVISSQLKQEIKFDSYLDTRKLDN